MNREALERIQNALQQGALSRESTHVLFPAKGYLPIPFSQQYFKKIQETETSKSVVYIDGGNAEIFHSPSCSVQLLRLCAVEYKEEKREAMFIKECFVLIQPREEEGTVFFALQDFPLKGMWKWETTKFAMDDPELQEGNFRPTIAKIGTLARRLAELEFAKELLRERRDCILLLDGTLQAGTKAEQNAFAALFAAAEKQSSMVAALAKTTDLFTDTSNAVGAVLEQQAPQGRWWYYPVVEITHPYHQAALALVKLHPASRHIFRLEWQQGGKLIDELLSCLARVSHDAAFPGYPYPFILADRFARVSNREKKNVQIQFLSLAGENGSILEAMQHSTDAHAILDTIG